jgi:hypothetical protein
LKSGSLSLLENQESVQTCAGIALPLSFTEEKGCVASGTLRPHQIPDQRFSQFNDTKNIERKIKLQTRRRRSNGEAEMKSIPPKFDAPCIKTWGPSLSNDDDDDG